MSASVTSRGLPGVQTSAIACAANAGMSLSLMPSSVRCCGIPTFMASARTASQAACAACSGVIHVVSTPMVRAITPNFSMHLGLLNSMMVGNSSALATPCGMSNNAPIG